MMTDLPAIVKVLKYMRIIPGEVTSADITRAVQESRGHVDRALGKLVREGILIEDQGFYHYRATPGAEEFSRKMLAVYEEVVRREKKGN